MPNLQPAGVEFRLEYGLRSLFTERPHYCFRVVIDDSQQDSGRTVRDAMTLLPVLQDTCIEPKAIRKFLTA